MERSRVQARRPVLAWKKIPISAVPAVARSLRRRAQFEPRLRMRVSIMLYVNERYRKY